jgi:hypothetical protein
MRLLSGSEVIPFILENYGPTGIASTNYGVSKFIFDALQSPDASLLLPDKKSLYWSLGHLSQNRIVSTIPEYYSVQPKSISNALLTPYYNSDCSITLSIAIPIPSEYFCNLNRLSIIKTADSSILCISPYRNVGKIIDPPRYLVGMAHMVAGREITIAPHGVLIYPRTDTSYNHKPNMSKQELEYPMPSLPVRPWDTSVAISTNESDIPEILTQSYWTLARYYLSLHANSLAMSLEVAFKAGWGSQAEQSAHHILNNSSDKISQSPHERAAHNRRLADGRVIKVRKSKVNYK